MNEQQIEQLFQGTINKTWALCNKVQGFSSDVVYNWKTGRTKPTIGDMLSILYQLKLITVNEPISQSH